MADISDVYAITGAGLQAQTQRMRVVSENIANAGTTPSTPTEKPYQRQLVTFKNVYDKVAGASVVKATGVVKDKSAYGRKFDPSHPAADPQGYIQTPNVNPLIEAMDMREAQRSYEANLGVLDASRVMILRTIDIIR